MSSYGLYKDVALPVGKHQLVLCNVSDCDNKLIFKKINKKLDNHL